MNKKIIAIAIASAMTAPAVMADISITGRMGGSLSFQPKETTANHTDTTKAARIFSDSEGMSRITFHGVAGNTYATIGYNDSNYSRDKSRELLMGYKMGTSSVQFGHMPGAAKNLEKDPYIATFLQARGTAGDASTATKYSSHGFVDSLVQYKAKAGAMTITGQFNPTDNQANSANNGHIALALQGKAGAVNYWVSYNNGAANGTGTSTSANQVNVKVGASMKMGAAKITVNVADADNGTSAGGNKETGTLVMADFGLGNGLSANAAFGSNSDRGTYIRAALAKKLSKTATLYGGATSTKAATSGASSITTFGVGAYIKF